MVNGILLFAILAAIVSAVSAWDAKQQANSPSCLFVPPDYTWAKTSGIASIVLFIVAGLFKVFS